MAAALTEDVKARIERAMSDLDIISTGWNESRTRTGQVKREKDSSKKMKDRDCEAPVL
jgi:hypothetical protein